MIPILKKSRITYLYLALSIFSFSIVSFLLSYFTVQDLIIRPEILRYSRGGIDGIGIFAAILFIIIAIGNSYCFIKNRPIPYHMDRKVSKFITYYSGFIIAIMPISAYTITNKLTESGYRICRTELYIITYAKTEQACKQYKIRHYPYRKYEDQ